MTRIGAALVDPGGSSLSGHWDVFVSNHATPVARHRVVRHMTDVVGYPLGAAADSGEAADIAAALSAHADPTPGKTWEQIKIELGL